MLLKYNSGSQNEHMGFCLLALPQIFGTTEYIYTLCLPTVLGSRYSVRRPKLVMVYPVFSQYGCYTPI